MIPNRTFFKIVFSTLPTPVADVWRTIESCLKAEKCLPKLFYVSQIAGHPLELHSETYLKLPTEELSNLIEERNLNGFRFNTGHSERSIDFDLRHYKEIGNQALLSCRINSKAKAPADWSRLIEGIMAQWSCVGGWQYFIPYQAWQWGCEKDKFYEQRWGEFPSGYKTYSDPDYDGMHDCRIFIDISNNPGRSKPLYPEIKYCPINFYPTAEMWLGPHFWQYAECTKEEALAADFFIEKRDTPHFLYLKSWPKPFTRPDGEQGRIQQKIWKLLFHEDCEWPPGSGGISDEPMYGPPELMP